MSAPKLLIPSLIFTLCLVSAPEVHAKGNPSRDFKKAAKKGDVAGMVSAAEAMDDPSKKDVQLLIKVGAMYPNVEVFHASRQALAKAKGAARSELLKWLKSKRAKVEQRVLCVDALGSSQDRASVKPLVGVLNDRLKPVRFSAIRALQRLEFVECIPPLYERLSKVGFKNPDAEVLELYTALQSLTGQSFETLEQWKKWWEIAKSENFDPKKRDKKRKVASTTTRGGKGQGKIFESVIRSQAFILMLDISSSMRVIDLPAGKKWTNKKGKKLSYKDPDPSGRKPPHKDSRFSKAREAFVKFIDALDARAKFAIVVFAAKGDTKLWKPAVVPATKANKKAAIKFVNSVRWGAATRTDLALERAFSISGADSIYMFSDGIPEKRKGGKSVDIPQEEVLKKARILNRAKKIKLNCYAMTSSNKTRAFLEKLAKENGGEYKDIRAHRTSP